MRWKASILALAAGALIAIGDTQAAQEREVTITSREIVQRLTRLEERFTRLEEGQRRLEERVVRLEEGQKRLEEKVTRLEEGQKSLAQRIDDLRQVVLGGFGVTLAGMFTLIGFVLWARRTAVVPVTRKVNELEAEHQRLTEAIQELSRDHPRSAEILGKLRIT